MQDAGKADENIEQLDVRAGLNEVEFSYRPYAFPWLLLLSWAALAGTAVVSATALARSRSPVVS